MHWLGFTSAHTHVVPWGQVSVRQIISEMEARTIFEGRGGGKKLLGVGLWYLGDGQKSLISGP